MQSDFTALTVYSHETPNLERLRRSAERFSWPFAERRLGERGHDKFLLFKHLFIREFLADLQVEHFLFIDAYDTIFISERRSLPFGYSLCFAGEKNCYPKREYAPIFDERASGPFPYLNSGIIWGSTELYMQHCPDYPEHDQLAWTRAAVEDPVILIDTHGGFGLNLHSTEPEDWSYQKGKWIYLPTNQAPAVLHGNGGWPIPSWAVAFGEEKK